MRPGSDEGADAPVGSHLVWVIDYPDRNTGLPNRQPALPETRGGMRNRPMFACRPDLLDCLVSEAKAVPYAFNVTPGGPVYV